MKFQASLRTRFAWLVMAAVVPLFALSIAKAWLDARAAVEREMDHLRLGVSLAASAQDRVTEAAHQMLVAFAVAPDIRSGNAEACKRYLNEVLQQFPIYLNLGIIGLDGLPLCDGLGPSSGQYVGDRYYFREAVAKRTFIAGEYIVGRRTGKSAVVFSYPVLDTKGDVAYVAYAAVDLAALSRAMGNLELPPTASLGVHDRSGVLLASSGVLPLKIGEKATNPVLLDAFMSMAAGVREGTDRLGRRRLWAFAPTSANANTAFMVVVSMDRELVVGPIKRELLLEQVILLLVALSSFGVAWWMGGRMIVRPTADILEATRELQTGKLDVRIPVQDRWGGDEFSSIAQGVNRMADSLEHLQQAQAANYAKLRETQNRLLDAQRLGHIGNWEMDLVTRHLTFSDGMYALSGLEPSTFDGRFESIIKIFHPDDRESFQQKLEVALRDGSELDAEYRIIKTDGEVRWMHQLGKLHVDEAGRPVCRTGVVQDITVRKCAELATAKVTESLRRTGEMVKVGGWDVNLETQEADWSDELVRLFELEPGHAVDLTTGVNFFEPEAQVVLRQAIREAIKNAMPWNLELPLVTAKGRHIWVRSQGHATAENGITKHLIGTMQDITAQYRSRQQLLLLETAIARLNDVVLITEAEPLDEPGPRIVFVNDAFVRHTGYSREEVLGRSPRFLQGPNTQRDELDRLAQSFKAWQPARAELINYTKAGEEFWVDMEIIPIANADGWFTHWVSVQRDITKRKEVEKALSDSEQRYAALFETAPIPMWVYDATDHRFLAVNRAAVESYGYSVDEFLSMTIFDIRKASEHAALRDRLRELTASQPFWQHRRKDGSFLLVKVIARPIRYAGGDACFVVASDITDQIRAETDVQDQLFTLQRAADAAQAITWHQTVDSMLQEVAEQARGVVGAHQAVVSLALGKDLRQVSSALSISEHVRFKDPRDLPDGSGLFAMVCENNRVVRVTQAELEAHPRWEDFRNEAEKLPTMRGWLAVPLTGREGQNIGLLQLSDKYEGDFTLQDEYVAIELAQLASIAIENARLLDQVQQLNAGLEQKVAERTQALAKQEALFRALADQAPQVIWTADHKGVTNYFNRAWFDLVGGTHEDWIGRKWSSVIHPDDLPGLRENWKRCVTTGAPFVGIRRLYGRDGGYHVMAYRAAPVFDPDGAVAFWVGIDADITEIKNIEAALRLSNQELEAFSYSVSHDLRAPLNTIDGFSRLLAKQMADDTGSKAQHYLARIQSGVAQMGTLIEDLLMLSQVSRMQLRHEPMDLTELSNHIIDEWRVRQPERKVVVEIETGLHAHGDMRLVRMVMENLLGNAWKFTSQKAEGHIAVGQTPDATGVPVFFVRDNGAGFEMAYASKLFVAFQRLHTATEFAGNGIGLATAERGIARHGGRLWAEASVGVGATFFFTLPKLITPQPVTTTD